MPSTEKNLGLYSKLKENRMKEWIKVNSKDDLPKEDCDCLVYDSMFNQKVVRFFNNYYKCWDDEDGDDCFCDGDDGRVTHYMHLPSSPI